MQAEVEAAVAARQQPQRLPGPGGLADLQVCSNAFTSGSGAAAVPSNTPGGRTTHSHKQLLPAPASDPMERPFVAEHVAANSSGQSCVRTACLKRGCMSRQGRLRQAIATIQEGLVERDTEVRLPGEALNRVVHAQSSARVDEAQQGVGSAMMSHALQ